MQVYDERYVPKPIGFHNTGSICWLNALLQSLLSCPTFVKTLIDHKDFFSKNPLGNALCMLVEDHYSGDPRAASWSGQIGKFLVTKNFGQRQECADEGLRMLLAMLRSPHMHDILLHRFRKDIVCFKCKKVRDNKDASSEDTEYTIKMFHYDQTKKFVNALRLQVNELEDAWKCETCSGKLHLTYSLTMVPEIIIVEFEKYRKKHLLTFPAEFYVDGVSGKKMLFKQVAQIEHSGSMHGGHYWATCLRQNKIYCLNDASCSPVKAFTPTPKTFMVFYSFVREEQA